VLHDSFYKEVVFEHLDMMYGWAYGCTLMAYAVCLQVGMDFWKIWGMAESKWCSNFMVEAANSVRLHPTSILDEQSVWVPWYDVWMHWAYGCPLMLLRLYRWGWIFGKLGVWLSPSDVLRSWLRRQTPVDFITHPYHIQQLLSTLISSEALAKTILMGHEKSSWNALAVRRSHIH
jgi:hypothetical protein